MAHNRIIKQTSWISQAKFEIENEAGFLECKRIVLRIVRYMKDNHLSQKELAARLNVTPQYVNKFLHGQDIDLKISTVIRYGNLLGIKLIEVPMENPGDNNLQINYVIKISVKEKAIQPSTFIYSNILPKSTFSMQ